MSKAPASLANHPAGPSAFQLSCLLNYMLGDFALNPALPCGRPVPGPYVLSQEFSASLDGPYQCLLNLRSTSAFASELSYAAGENGLALSPAEAFEDFCHAVAVQFSLTFLNGSPERLDGFQPQATRPSQWPPSPPDLEIALLYKDQPLEARLWTAPSVVGGFPTKFPGLL